MDTTRRGFIYGTLAAAAAPVIGAEAKQPAQWYSFSRVFQKFGLEKAAELLAQAGYTGVEWTVRPGGFVEPERARKELPRAIEIARRNGLGYETVIVEFLDPYAGEKGGGVDLLKIAADCGVKNYRPGYLKYSFTEKTARDFDNIRRGFDKFEKAARESGLRCLYQNHSTYNRQVPLVGSLVWDLWELLKDRDPKYMGVQYDVMHARAESGPSWQRGLGLIAPWIGTLCLKDFKFAMDPKYPGDWKRVLVPAGEGIVDWAEFLAICRREGVAAPYSVHYDYPFPENDSVAAFKAAKKDLDFFRSHLGE